MKNNCCCPPETNTAACGCCEGVEVLTPLPTANRPGLSALSYRVGTHASFLETMQARLSSSAYPELEGLTTREANDFSIALLDGWATIADVLTFYQERIANEGYLRTATERRSVLELGRLVGYEPRPGVASSVYLAYKLDDNFKEETVIPKGARAQSIPGPGELPQSFETSEDLKARAKWNDLKPRMRRPQDIRLVDAQTIPNLYVEGITTNLKPNDPVLLVFGDAHGQQIVRRTKNISADFENDCTEVTLQEVPFLVVAALDVLRAGLAWMESELGKAVATENASLKELRNELRDLIATCALGDYPPLTAAYFSHDSFYANLSVDQSHDCGMFCWLHSVFHLAQQAININLTGLFIALLDKVMGIVATQTFKHDLLCLMHYVFEQSRPTSYDECCDLTSFASQLTYQVNSLWEFISSNTGLKFKAYTVLDELKPLLSYKEIRDQLNELLDVLIKISADQNDEEFKARLISIKERLNDSTQLDASISCGGTPIATTDLGRLVASLVIPPSIPPASSLRLRRDIAVEFSKHADTLPKVLTSWQPRLKQSLYQAWAGARVEAASKEPTPLAFPSSLFNIPKNVFPAKSSSEASALTDALRIRSVHALRWAAEPFGHNAPQKTKLVKNPDPEVGAEIEFISVPDDDWLPADQGDEETCRLFLASGQEEIVPGAYVLISTKDGVGGAPILARAVRSLTRPRTAYGVSAKATQLELSKPWWDAETMEYLRDSVVHAETEALGLASAPVSEDVTKNSIELEGLLDGLSSGRWVVVRGARSDIPGATQAQGAELAMISSIEQVVDDEHAGDRTYSKIGLDCDLAYRFRRDSVTVLGNVVKATHGETRKEVLGSGDGAKTLQSFELKQPPLTYVSAANPSGVDSTLEVYVNDVQWHEQGSLAGLSATDRSFITKTDDDGKTTVTFGNGKEGARLPSGIENIRATYRSGIGKPGNVDTEQISLLTTRPLGVKEVINPLPASGGADKETRDQARRNAPLAMMALDRLVSVQDYEDFSRTYAGVGKARAVEISDGRRQLVHVTIAGADDIPIDESSDLYRNLKRALLDFGDPYQPIRLAIRELMLIVISAGVRILPDYQWEPVVTQVRSALLDAFSFDRRELGQDVLLSEVISVMQGVRGVAYVDVDIFGGLPEREVRNGKRELLTPETIADKVSKMGRDAEKNPKPIPDPRVEVNLSKPGSLLPAQLAFLSPEVPETLVLNQIT